VPLGNRSPFMVVPLALAAVAGGCQTDSTRDVSGQPILLSEEKNIEPADATLNVTSFFARPFIAEIKRTVRDNMVPQYKFLVRDGSGAGLITSGHVGGNSRWSGGENIWDENKFRQKAGEFLGDLRDLREIRHKNAKAGFRRRPSHWPYSGKDMPER